MGVRRRVSPLRSAGPAGAHLCVGLPGPADALERGRSFGRARFIPRPEAAPGAGGAVGTAWTVLAPPRAPAHVGRRPPPPPRRLRFSPRRGPGGHISSPGYARCRTRRRRPRRCRPDSAVRAPSGAGDRAPLRLLLRESAAPGSPLWRPGHASARGAAGPSARTSATAVAREAPASSGFVAAIAGFLPVAGDEGLGVQRRLHDPVAAAHLSFQRRGAGG